MPGTRDAERAAWLLGRLLAMSPAEIGLRVMRSARVRGGRRVGPQAVLARASRTLGALDGGDVLRSLEAERGTLLAGAREEEALRACLRRIGVPERESAQVADAVLEGSIPAFGWTTLEAGRPADWLRDPVSGRRWPLTHWAALDYRAHGVPGDPRYVWEVNRCHHLVTLGRAFVLTRDAKYARAVWDAIASWIAANPPHFGINWASPLEVGIRLISWALALDLVGGEGADEERARDLAVSVWLQARHVSDNLSLYASSRNNHLIGEAAGLLVAGAKFRWLPGADGWARNGRRIVEREVLTQVTADGVPREQAFQYGVFVLEFCLAATGGGRAVSGGLTERVGSLSTFLSAVAGADGSVPSIGDGDGGRAYELSDRPGRQAPSAAACGAILAGLPAPRGFEPADAEPGVWLFGPGAVTRWLDASPGAPADAGSRAFVEGGYFVSGGRELRGVIDCGPLGYRSIAAHGHADCLSVAICLGDDWVVADPGTYCYHRERLWRDHFRSTAAHNTVTVDGESQSRILGSFLWGRRAHASAARWASHPLFDFFEGTHDGYARRGVIHRRRVLFARRGYWIVLDDLEGTGQHEVSATFQFDRACFAVGAALPDGALEHRVDVAGGRTITVRSWLPEGMSAEIVEGRVDPPGGWVSSGFGEKHPAPALVARGRLDLPARAAFAIVPGRAGEDSVSIAGTAIAQDGALFEASFPGGRDVWTFGRVKAPERSLDFSGAVGLKAIRSGETNLFGLDVAGWTESGSDVAYASVVNLLATDTRRKERAER
jgi:hypothetical protein